jgi:hypothetical protein
MHPIMLDKIFSQHPTIYKYDRTWIGVLLGLTVPALGVVLVYLLSVANHYAIGDDIITIPMLVHNITTLLIFTKFLSVGCILNLGVFFLFINRDYFNIARGIIFATILVSLPIIVVTVRNFFI